VEALAASGKGRIAVNACVVGIGPEASDASWGRWRRRADTASSSTAAS
jgi:hypothetical protein